ncbi:cation diffusion facilitator family transporter [Novosphingobium terrae]|uniref:cation diffusion facilitator family transporter n=1 Tax=Novosphingobium terrae TaxID=2726189 RepID=UPI001981256A|nr:cation diffusion facilitator family transporter [Novosphingobium terrae]
MAHDHTHDAHADSAGQGHDHHDGDHDHDHDHDHGHSHGHGHAHGHHHHGHGHGHGHHHHGVGHGKAFAIAVGLNTVFVVVEGIAGFIGHSVALLADAGHNLSDVLSLLLAWGASHLAQKPPSARFTYGLKSSSILAALANAALLWVALGAILIETIRALFTPETVEAPLMIGVAAAGIAVNGLSAVLFARGSKEDINLRAAFQHLMADALVSAGVVVAGIVVAYTGWRWLDPVTSLVITAMIGLGSWSLLRESVHMGLLAVPEGINEEKVRAYLASQEGVSAVHDLHIWPMSTTETALTAHLVIPGGHPGDAFLHGLAETLEKKFRIGHSTIQVECNAEVCSLHPEGVV